jgi:hypothetical protein
VFVGGRAHHPGVAVTPRAAEEPDVADPQRGHRAPQLPDPVAAELVGLVGGQLGELGDQHLTLLAQGAGEQGDRRPLGDVARHGGAAVDRLVVGMGVDQQEALISHDKTFCRSPAAVIIGIWLVDTPAGATTRR